MRAVRCFECDPDQPGIMVEHERGRWTLYHDVELAVEPIPHKDTAPWEAAERHHAKALLGQFADGVRMTNHFTGDNLIYAFLVGAEWGRENQNELDKLKEETRVLKKEYDDLAGWARKDWEQSGGQ